MKTIPIAKPGAGPAPTTDHAATANAARARAISKMETPTNQIIAESLAAKGIQVQPNPVPVNANQVSVEELAAVRQPLQSNKVVEDQSQSQPDPVDTAPAEQKPSKPATTPDNEPSNSQLAILARKERALRAKAQQQEQAISAERQQWQQEKAALQAQIDEIKSSSISKQYLKSNPLDALQQADLSYDELTQQAMNTTATDPRVLATIQRMDAKIQDLQGKLEQASKGAQEAQTQQYQAALKQIETDVKSLVKQDPSFEMIKFTRSEKDVVDLIERTYKEDGYVMTVEEASQEVENYLVDEASRLARLEKVKRRVSPSPAPATNAGQNAGQQKQTPNQQQPQQMKTLTNTASSSRKLDNRERAILAFKGELKS